MSIKSKPETKRIDALLKKVEKVIINRKITINDFAKEIKEAPQKVYQWFSKEGYKPNAEAALKIQDWLQPYTTVVGRSKRHIPNFNAN